MREKRKPCRKRSLEELNVIDDFLMNAAASDPEGGAEFCRLLLSALLERNITAVTVNTQKVLPAYTPELHGIRMDVEVREETETILNIYDIEPCLYHAGVENLAKRNRFYQGKIDGRYLAGGEKDYSHLPNPVSYTHLDVYKRQLLFRAGSRLCAAFSAGRVSG